MNFFFSLLSLFVYPWMSVCVAIFFFVMAGYTAGRHRGFARRIVLWCTPIFWLCFAFLNFAFQHGKGVPIRLDLLVAVPFLGLLSIVALFLMIRTPQEETSDSPE